MGKPVIGEVVVLLFPQGNLQSGKRRNASGKSIAPCLTRRISNRGSVKRYKIR